MREFFVYFPFVCFVLVLVGFVWPGCRQLQLRTRAQAVWTMVILLCFSKFLCFEAFGGDLFNPDLPRIVILVWDWAYSGAMILVALTFIWWLLVLLIKPLRGKCAAFFILPVLAWGLSADGIWNGIRAPLIREVELKYENLPASLEGYRICHLTDPHASALTDAPHIAEVVRLANSTKSDLIVVTGDLVDGSVEKRRGDVEPLKELSAKDGVYFVTGNHEFYHHWEEWSRVYEEWGFRFLRNGCVFPHDGLALGGLDDDGSYLAGDLPQPNLDEVFACATNGEFRVLLKHRPAGTIRRDNPEDFDLQLSGHTHGGIMPVLSYFVAKYNYGFVRGLYEAGKKKLYVSPGCGQWEGFPIRFLNPSEIIIITLRKGHSQASDED